MCALPLTELTELTNEPLLGFTKMNQMDCPTESIAINRLLTLNEPICTQTPFFLWSNTLQSPQTCGAFLPESGSGLHSFLAGASGK